MFFNRNEKQIAVKYFDMEVVSVKGFCAFCKNNVPLIIAVTFALFFTYGIKLFWYSIGIDMEILMADKTDILRFFAGIGRWGLVLLHKILWIREFNPFTTFFTAFCLIWFFTVSWCYIIAIFCRDTGKNNKLIPFALVFMASTVWVEQFYFVFQATENALIILMCPYVIYMLYKGFLDNEKGKIICAATMLVLMFSVYQAIVPMFCCGVFAVFLLLQNNTDYESRIYRNLCIGIFIVLVVALAGYYLIDKLIVQSVFKIEKQEYLSNYQLKQFSVDKYMQNIWRSIKGIFINPSRYAIKSFIVRSPLGYIVNPTISDHAVNRYTQMTSDKFNNALLLPTIISFLVSIVFVLRNRIPSGRRLLYILAGIGIPVSIIILYIINGSRVPLRSLYALPLAYAFMLFFLIKITEKRIAIIISCLALFIAVHQAQVSAQIFYSDYIRYNEDVRIAYEIDKLISSVQPKDKKLPVAIVGINKEDPFSSKSFFIEGQTPGNSFFIWDVWNIVSMSKRRVMFMNTLGGIHYDIPNAEQIIAAGKISFSMPVYPDPACVQRVNDDFIIVKLFGVNITDLYFTQTTHPLE